MSIKQFDWFPYSLYINLYTYVLPIEEKAAKLKTTWLKVYHLFSSFKNIWRVSRLWNKKPARDFIPNNNKRATKYGIVVSSNRDTCNVTNDTTCN